MCVCVYTKIQLDICKYTYIFMAIFHGYLVGFGITLENHRVCMPVKLLLKRFNRRGGSAILWAGPRKDTETGESLSTICSRLSFASNSYCHTVSLVMECPPTYHEPSYHKLLPVRYLVTE